MLIIDIRIVMQDGLLPNLISPELTTLKVDSVRAMARRLGVGRQKAANIFWIHHHPVSIYRHQ